MNAIYVPSSTGPLSNFSISVIASNTMKIVKTIPNILYVIIKVINVIIYTADIVGKEKLSKINRTQRG